MRILIAGFLEAHQYAEEIHLINLLSKELEAYGHQVDHFELPYKDAPVFLPEQAYAVSSIGSLECDMLVTVGFPAFLLEHPNKFVFLCSLTPMLREYWDATYGTIQSTQYAGIRETTLALQADELRCARKVFCGTKALYRDLKAENIRAELFTLPPDDTRMKGQRPEGDYVIAEALSEYGEDINSLHEIAAYSDGSWRVLLYMGYNEERFQFFQQKIKEEQLQLELRKGKMTLHDLRGARAFIDTSFQMRRPLQGCTDAFALGIPVIAMQDSGFAAERILNGKNGYLVHGTEETADLINRLYSNPKLYRRLLKNAARNRQNANLKQIVKEMVD